MGISLLDENHFKFTFLVPSISPKIELVKNTLISGERERVIRFTRPFKLWLNSLEIGEKNWQSWSRTIVAKKLCQFVGKSGNSQKCSFTFRNIINSN